MKKIFSILAVVMLFTACEQNIQTNTPAFQAKLDGDLWRAKDAKVTIDATGGMTITAFTSAQTVIMKTRAAAVGTYILGTTDYASNHASYDIATAALEDFYDTSVVFGPAYKLSALTSGGTGYVESPAGAQTTGGSGSGLRVATEVTNGAVTKITMVSRGLGYKAGDIITIVGGANNAKFKVVNVQSSNGEVVVTDTAGGLYSGTFKFNAVNEEGKVITFSEGHFFKIPLGL